MSLIDQEKVTSSGSNSDKLFEIEYVEHEQPFYQLEKNYVYQLRCELYRYEDEVIDISIEDVDDEVEISTGFTKTLVLVGVADTGQSTTPFVLVDQ